MTSVLYEATLHLKGAEGLLVRWVLGIERRSTFYEASLHGLKRAGGWGGWWGWGAEKTHMAAALRQGTSRCEHPPWLEAPSSRHPVPARFKLCFCEWGGGKTPIFCTWKCISTPKGSGSNSSTRSRQDPHTARQLNSRRTIKQLEMT